LAVVAEAEALVVVLQVVVLEAVASVEVWRWRILRRIWWKLVKYLNTNHYTSKSEPIITTKNPDLHRFFQLLFL
jgi:hypothetical protein